MRKVLYGIWKSLIIFLGCVLIPLNGCKKNEDIPTLGIKTTSVWNIAQTTATCGGTIISDGGSKITASGVCWSSNPNPTLENNKTVDLAVSGSFTSFISELLPNAKYFVRAYATNDAGIVFGNEIEFVTLYGQVPVLSTISISNITQTSATCGGDITFDGGLTITLRGVCYGTSPNPTLANSFTSDGTGIGKFQSTLTGISSGTTYYIRAYATNSFGTTYGNELSFSTIVPPSIITTAFYDVQGISAKAGGIIISNGGDKNLLVGLCWGTSPEPTVLNSFNRSYNSPMVGLVPNTVYYARTYATNKAGTAYGNQISFNSGYIMGYNRGGGLVFYNDGGIHGLVSSETDQSTGSIWGCYGTVTYAFSTGINTGRENTSAIVSACSAPVFAAKTCSELFLKKYTDWYLPSADELNLMYLNLHKKNLGGFKNYYYWSSSEFGDVDAWLQDFSGGNRYYYLKSQQFYVRAIRAF